jgi:hypothetical protein
MPIDGIFAKRNEICTEKDTNRYGKSTWSAVCSQQR